MKNKFFILLILSVLFSLFIVGTANAAFTCASASPTVIHENTQLNVTFADDGNLNTSISVAYFIFSGLTANSSSTILFTNITNTTTISASFTLGDYNADVLEDDSTYTIAPIAYNGSLRTGGATQVSCTTQTGIVFDRSKPNVPTTTQASESTVKSGDIITYDVNGANVSKCRIAFLTSGAVRTTGSNTFAMTHSGDTCKFTLTGGISDGAYNLYALADDGTNSSLSSKLLVNVNTISDDVPDVTGEIEVAVAQQVSADELGTILIWLIVIGGGSWYFFTQFNRKN